MDALGAISAQTEACASPRLHFFNLPTGGHSSLEPRLPIPNRTVKRVCADDSVPIAHAKVGYRQAIFKRKTPGSRECRGFLFAPAQRSTAAPGSPVSARCANASQALALLLERETRVAGRNALACAIADVDDEVRLEASIWEKSGVELGIVEARHRAAVQPHGAQRDDEIAALQAGVAKGVDLRHRGLVVPIDRIRVV